MISVSPSLVLALVGAGMVLLCASLLAVRDILGMLRLSWLRHSWILLTGLIVLFIPGYAAFGWMRTRSHSTVSDLVVASILFFGGCFVLGVTCLSRHTAKELHRIAGLERDALVDPLTGLFNRRYLFDRFDEEADRAHRYGLNLAAILVDIDHFKLVNDKYGHRAGDEVLVQVAGVIGAESRTCDIAFRYGGDEILLIATATDAAKANYLAERLRRTIKEKTIVARGARPIAITVSVGVAALNPKDNAISLIERADHALYEAKRQGRDRVCIAPCDDPADSPYPEEGTGNGECQTTRPADLTRR